MRRADFRASEHGNRQLGHHAHIDRDAVALHDAERLQRIRKTIYFALEHAERQHARVARFALPDDRRLVSPRRMRVAIDAVVRDVQFPAHKPLGPRRIPLQHALPRREPVQMLRLRSPEALRVLRRVIVNRGIVPVGGRLNSSEGGNVRRSSSSAERFLSLGNDISQDSGTKFRSGRRFSKTIHPDLCA